MNLKKLVKPMFLALCISLTVPAFANIAGPGTVLTTVPVETPSKTVDPLVRLQEIKNMDLKNMSRVEKKALRKEVKGLRKQLKASSNGIYLSLGAIIIIVLLLLLLL